MLAEVVPAWRVARVLRLGPEVRIACGPRRILSQGLAALCLIVFWAIGFHDLWQKFVVATDVSRRHWIAGSLIFLLVWGAWGLPRLVGMWLGRELIIVTPQILALRSTFLGLGRWRRFELSKIHNAYYEIPPVGFSWPRFRGRARIVSTLGGCIAFQYANRWHRFAAGIDWPDMATVLEAVRERISVASGPQA